MGGVLNHMIGMPPFIRPCLEYRAPKISLQVAFTRLAAREQGQSGQSFPTKVPLRGLHAACLAPTLV